MDAVLQRFISEIQVQIIFWLLFVDVMLGLAGAIKLGVFALGKVADFARTKVAPYLIGYLALWIVAEYGIPDWNGLPLGGITSGVFAAILIVNLGDDIRRHLVDLGIPLPGLGSTILDYATLIVPPQTTMAINTPTVAVTSNGVGDVAWRDPWPGPQPPPAVDPSTLPTTDDPPDR